MARVAQAGLTALAALAVAAPGVAAAPKLFPSDARNTVRDPTQQTGKRIQLRLPSCQQRPSDCNDIALLNRLDGFDIDPRIEVRFDRAIDVRQVNRRTLYVQPVDRGPRIGVDRLVYDSRRRILSARPAELLRGGVRYRLVVALGGQRARTTFTTMTATLQTRAMRIVAARRPPRLTVSHRFRAADVRGMRVRRDTGAGVEEAAVPDLARAGGGVYAFGQVRTRQWLRQNRTIRDVATERTPRVVGTQSLGVAMILPEGSPPAGGWPVAIIGHGFTRSRLDLFLAADANARRGLATLAISAPGHDGGPGGRLLVDTADGATADVPFPGRSIDLNADGLIGSSEGAFAALPPSPVSAVVSRDVLRQAALDVAALAASVRRGVDVDGNGETDLSRTRVGYYGQSFGAIYGAIAAALDRRLRPAVLNAGGGPLVDVVRLGVFRPLIGETLARRRPDPRNGGRAGFTEATPLRGQGPVVDPPPGAMLVDQGLANVRWIGRSGDPVAYAPALMGDLQVAVQVAYADRTVPNPTSAELIRAGDLGDRTVLYADPQRARRDPHGFLIDPRHGRDRELAQDQVVDLLLGQRLRDPDGAGRVWQRRPRISLLDRLNFRP